MQACAYENENVVPLLLKDENVDINAHSYSFKTSLMIACNENNVKIVKLLLQNENIIVNTKSDRCSKCMTALMIACRNGNEKIVSLLLKHENIKVDIKDTSKKTCLTYARENNHQKIISLLDDYSEHRVTLHLRSLDRDSAFFDQNLPI